MPDRDSRSGGPSRFAARLRLARRGAGPAQVPEPEPPGVVSVVVPVYGARAYLDECLDSLRAQSYPHLEIVVVDDGSTDGSAQICARHAGEDARIQVHRQENAGLGAARNAGIARATGTFLTFLDADDTLPPDAYQLMVQTLGATGSDFVVGSVQRLDRGRLFTPPWIAEVHLADRRAISIDDFPLAVNELISCNRMFRRSFWERADLAFPEGVAYEDYAPMLAAYVRARSFDVLTASTYVWRVREDDSSISQQRHETKNLRDRLRAWSAAWDLVGAEVSPAVLVAWRARDLDLGLPMFLAELPGADDEYFELVRANARELLESADAGVLAQVRAERKVKAYLAADGRRDELEALATHERQRGPVGPTSVEGGSLVADFPDVPDLPVEVRRLTDRQTALRATLRRCRWSAPGVLELDVSAYIPYLDLTAVTPTARAWWVEDDSGDATPADLTSYTDPEITRSAMPTAQSYDPSGLRLTLQVAALLGGSAPTADAERRWHLELEVSAAGLVRRGVVRHRDPRGSAASLRPSGLPGGVRVELEQERAGGVAITVRGSAATLERVSLVDGGLVVSARAVGTAAVQRLTAVAGDGTRTHVRTAGRGRVGQGTWRLEELRTPGSGDRWQLRATTESGSSVLAWPEEGESDWLDVAGTSALLARRTATSGVQIVVPTPTVEVVDAELAGDRLALTTRWLADDVAGPTATLLRDARGPDHPPAHRVALVPAPARAGGRSVWELPGGPGVLPGAGEWALTMTAGTAQDPVRVRIAPSLLARLPELHHERVQQGDRTLRRSLVRVRGGAVGLLVEPWRWAPL